MYFNFILWGSCELILLWKGNSLKIKGMWEGNIDWKLRELNIRKVWSILKEGFV